MKHRNSSHLLGVSLALIVALTACSGDPAPTTDEDVPKAFANQRLLWRGCGDGESFQAGEAVKGEAECVFLRVPTDYSNPDSGEQTLGLARLQARGKRAGVLVVNLGGPGAPAAASLGNFAEGLPDEVRDSLDVVALDPRAVGESGYLSCTDPQVRTWTEPLDGTPDDETERAALAGHLQRLGASCKERQPSLIGHLGTEELARDVDVLRSALGVEQVDVLGFSYGTLLAYEYSRLFPTRLHRMVLDGVVVPGESPVAGAKARGLAGEEALAQFLYACVEEDCSLGADEDEARATLDQLTASLDRKPVPVTGRSPADAVDESWFTAVLFNALYAPDFAFELPDAVAALRKGDSAAFVNLANRLSFVPGSLPGNVQNGLHLAMTCLDAPRVEVTDADRAAIEGTSPTFGRLLAANASLCADWPVPARPLTRSALPATTGAKAMLISNAADPATPREGAEQVRRLLPDSVHLRAQTWGHTAVLTGFDCVDSAAADFLLEGTKPAAAECTP